MSDWEKRVTDHAVHATLQNLGGAISTAQEKASDATMLESLDRLRRVQQYAQRLFRSVDPFLVPLSILNSAQETARAAYRELKNFNKNPNSGHLDNAHSHIDTLIQHLQAVPLIAVPEDVEGVQESVVRFRRSAGQHLGRLEKRIATFQSTLEQLQQQSTERSQEIVSQKGRLDSAIQQFVKQSSEAEERRSSELIQALADFNKQSSEGLAQQKESLRQLRKDAEDALQQEIRSLKETASAAITSLDQQKDRAAELVGIIARTGMAGGFEQAASADRAAADRWRLVAVGGMAGVIAVAVYTLLSTAYDVFAPGPFAAKVFSSLAFVILAGYAAREAGLHRKRESVYTRLRLELASLDPYLETLPEAERNAIKALVADRIFGRPDNARQSDETSVGASPIMEILRLVRPAE